MKQVFTFLLLGFNLLLEDLLFLLYIVHINAKESTEMFTTPPPVFIFFVVSFMLFDVKPSGFIHLCACINSSFHIRKS